jgi:outer membrane protein TolC
MVETYIRTIYQAMREVDNSLSVIRLSDKRLALQKGAADAARRGWRISIRAFSMGGGDFMSLLDAQRNFNRFSEDYRRARADSLKGYIALFHSLGGGVPLSSSTVGKAGRPGANEMGHIKAAIPTSDSPDAVPPSATSNVAEPALEFFGIDRTADGDAPFWQIELPGLYHRSAVSAVWRDLQARFPDLMAQRAVLPRLVDKADEGGDLRDAWYHLTIARFDSEEEAANYCRQLIAQHDRCRIVTSLPGAKAIEVASEASSSRVTKPSIPQNVDPARMIDGQ